MWYSSTKPFRLKEESIKQIKLSHKGLNLPHQGSSSFSFFFLLPPLSHFVDRWFCRTLFTAECRERCCGSLRVWVYANEFQYKKFGIPPFLCIFTVNTTIMWVIVYTAELVYLRNRLFLCLLAVMVGGYIVSFYIFS